MENESKNSEIKFEVINGPRFYVPKGKKEFKVKTDLDCRSNLLRIGAAMINTKIKEHGLLVDEFDQRMMATSLIRYFNEREDRYIEQWKYTRAIKNPENALMIIILTEGFTLGQDAFNEFLSMHNIKP